MLDKINLNELINTAVVLILIKPVSDLLGDSFKGFLKTILTAIFRAIFRALKFLFVRSEQDLIIWTHYKSRAAKDNHKPKHPQDCSDGQCQKI